MLMLELFILYGSPSQSPAIGISPGLPNPKMISAKPIVFSLHSMNRPLRYTPIVSIPKKRANLKRSEHQKAHNEHFHEAVCYARSAHKQNRLHAERAAMQPMINSYNLASATP
jgi:hypothetical protein